MDGSRREINDWRPESRIEPLWLVASPANRVRYRLAGLDKRISVRLLFWLEVFICLAFEGFKLC